MSTQKEACLPRMIAVLSSAAVLMVGKINHILPYVQTQFFLGVPYLLTCEDPLVFNEEAQVCDWCYDMCDKCKDCGACQK